MPWTCAAPPDAAQPPAAMSPRSQLLLPTRRTVQAKVAVQAQAQAQAQAAQARVMAGWGQDDGALDSASACSGSAAGVEDEEGEDAALGESDTPRSSAWAQLGLDSARESEAAAEARQHRRARYLKFQGRRGE